jgi:hypothetical protein
VALKPDTPVLQGTTATIQGSFTGPDETFASANVTTTAVWMCIG